jgi:hypothetical protein
MLLLPDRSTDDRFTPIIGPYLKLIDRPKGAVNGLRRHQTLGALLPELMRYTSRDVRARPWVAQCRWPTILNLSKTTRLNRVQ